MLKLYKERGINAYLMVSSRGKRDEKLTMEEKQTLSSKLQDPGTNITSYVELMHWVNQEFGRDIPYHVIYNYCRVRLKSRLKSVGGSPTRWRELSGWNLD